MHVMFEIGGAPVHEELARDACSVMADFEPPALALARMPAALLPARSHNLAFDWVSFSFVLRHPPFVLWFTIRHFYLLAFPLLSSLALLPLQLRHT